MAYLFLDTTNGLTLGLLDLNFNWMFYEDFEIKKPSEIIHFQINSILEKNKIKIEDTKLILVSGPGSYTGMRLGEGVANILKLCGISIYSFFHFEVPAFVNIKSGIWITNAFKKQFFVYKWDETTNSKTLIDMDEYQNDSSVYSNSELPIIQKNISTKKIIYDSPKVIFEKVLNRNEFYPSFYFRKLDEEFRSV